MSAVVPLRRGRLPADVERLRDLEVEVIALADDGRDFAGAVRHLSRIAQLQLVAGQSPATTLDRLERLAARQETTLAALAARARAEQRPCPDVEGPEIGHGRAA